MSSISVISNLKMFSSSTLPKKNNYVKNELSIINQSKFLIFTEALLGINRLYLFQYNKLNTVLFTFYSLVVLSVFVGYSIMTIHFLGGVTYQVTSYAFDIEYTLFVIIALTSKNKLKIFFKNLYTFDKTLNIQNDLAITSSKKRVIAWTLAVSLVNLLEIFLIFAVYHPLDLFNLFGVYVMTTCHDFELIFFFTFLRYIYMRILILKAHVAKLFDSNWKLENKLTDVEKLSEMTKLDVSTLHRVYDLLHISSEQLNSAINFPIIVIFFKSSLSTILLLKLLVSTVQLEDSNNVVHLIVLYVMFRCLKYTILVVIPCYYSSMTAAQTTVIRTILHDAVDTMPMTKTERRKVKAFFFLARESDFSHVIGGAIKLNMSLPLSYMSLCTTYLVILVQFSKFIDA